MINIIDILKDVPKGTKLYTPLYGEVFFEKICENKVIRVISKSQQIGTYFNKYGQYHKAGECLLFPSKENRDWNNFSIEKEKEYDFKPFDKVIVRDYADDKWQIDLFSHINNTVNWTFSCLCSCWRQCLPYNEKTAKLIGTTDDYKE